MNGLYGIPRAGMQSASFQLDVVANNIANANTSGYQSVEPIVDSLPSQSALNAAPVSPPKATNIGMGSGTYSVERNQTQAPLVQTGNPLDLAIEGPGMFSLKNGNGQIVYAPEVSLHLQADGQLVTDDGLTLNPPVRAPGNVASVEVDGKGNFVGQTHAGATVALGKPATVSFPAPENLGLQGNSRYAETLSSGRPATSAAGTVSVMSGYRLGSTVDLGTQMVALIQAERTFQANTKALQTMDSLVNNVVSIVTR